MSQAQRTKRRTRDELERLMLDAGREVLIDLPATVGSEQLTYSLVFQKLATQGIKVTTGSVHERLWNSQRDYQLAVMAEILQEAPHHPFDIAMSGAIEALEHADLSTTEGRRYAAQNTTRLVQNRAFNVDGFRTREESLAYAVRFFLWENRDMSGETARIAELAQANRQVAVDLYSEAIESLMQTLGLRVKALYGDDAAEMIAILGNAMFVGPVADPVPAARKVHKLPTGPNGELEEWYTGTIGLWALVQGLLELDGDDLEPFERQL